MHESTRRLLCRVAFLLGCVVPTMCTLSWITYRQSSWSVAAVEAELSDTIGLKCRIAKYYNPKPSKWVFEQVRLERAGSDAVFFPVLKAELVDETWLFSADEAEVAWNAHARLWEAVQEGLLLSPTNQQVMQLTVKKVRFTDMNLPPIMQLVVKHDPSSQPALASNLTLGELPSSPLMKVAVDTSLPQHWKVLFDARETPIATDHLAQIIPQFGDLGSDAEFLGTMSFELNHPAPYVELQGMLQQIDLKVALSQRFHEHGGGGANLVLNEVVIRDNSLVKAQGGILSYEGQISRSLLNRAAQHLGLQVVPPVRNIDLVGYHEMAIRFNFDQGRMTLDGKCEKMPEGTMLAGLEQPLVFESPVSILPATNLASVFYGTQSPTVPASQPAVDMARWLTAPILAERPGSALR